MAAHELGHLLIETVHNEQGVMRHRFDAADLRHCEQGLLRFTAEEGADIRRRLASVLRSDSNTHLSEAIDEHQFGF